MVRCDSIAGRLVKKNGDGGGVVERLKRNGRMVKTSENGP